MCHFVLGLFLLVWTVAALAAEPEQDAFKLDLLSIQPAYAQGENPGRRPIPYRFSAGVVLTTVPDVSLNRFVTGGAAPGISMAEPKRDAAWAARSEWQMISGGDRPSLSALLRFGSPVQRLEIRPRRHSIWIHYVHDFD